MTFKERLKRYKKEEDYFVVDIYKGGAEPYETIHDLTWPDVQEHIRKAKRNDKVSGIEIYVEDWDSDNENLFKYVSGVQKKAIRFNVNIKEGCVIAIAWK